MKKELKYLTIAGGLIFAYVYPTLTMVIVIAIIGLILFFIFGNNSDVKETNQKKVVKKVVKRVVKNTNSEENNEPIRKEKREPAGEAARRATREAAYAARKAARRATRKASESAERRIVNRGEEEEYYNEANREERIRAEYMEIRKATKAKAKRKADTLARRKDKRWDKLITKPKKQTPVLIKEQTPVIKKESLLKGYDKIYFDTNIFMGEGKEFNNLFNFILERKIKLNILSEVYDELTNMKEKSEYKSPKGQGARIGIKRIIKLGDHNLANFDKMNIQYKGNKKSYADPELIKLFDTTNKKILLVSDDGDVINRARGRRQHSNNPHLGDIMTKSCLMKELNKYTK